MLATWVIRSEKRHFQSDLLVPFCLQQRSDKGRIRVHACISYVGTFLSRHKGEACVPCSHLSQATNSSLLSRAPRWHCSLDETALHPPFCSERSQTLPEGSPNCSSKMRCYGSNSSSCVGRSNDRPARIGFGGQSASEASCSSWVYTCANEPFRNT